MRLRRRGEGPSCPTPRAPWGYFTLGFGYFTLGFGYFTLGFGLTTLSRQTRTSLGFRD